MTIGDAQIFAAEEEGTDGSVYEGTVNGKANYRCKVVLDAHLRDDARTRKLAPELVDCKDRHRKTISPELSATTGDDNGRMCAFSDEMILRSPATVSPASCSNMDDGRKTDDSS